MLRVLFFFFIASSAFAGNLSWPEYQKRVLSHQHELEGWCSQEKAKKMMELIYETQPNVCVEIGVFGGASIYPTASALKYLKKGKVYAIDPWENSACLVGYETMDPNYIWWSAVDLRWIYHTFLDMLKNYSLKSYCHILKMTSKEALKYFDEESIDILHIDGNHTENVALGDAEMYFSKVKKGGYIWLDDANWPTTQKAVEFLLSRCEQDEMLSTGAYLLFRKGNL